MAWYKKTSPSRTKAPPVPITPPPVLGADKVPLQAINAGYTNLTFSNQHNFATSNVDIGKTYAAGYNWYISDYGTVGFNSDGSVTVGTTQLNGNGNGLTSAVAFGGGGYFEFIGKFDTSKADLSQGWPAFWFYSYEHAKGLDQWPGQVAGYQHFIEPDLMEYWQNGAGNSAITTLHDWYGVANAANNWQNKDVSSVVDFTIGDTTQYHKYGLLWIPATATTQGSITIYLDDVFVTEHTYSLLPQTAVPAPRAPWLFSVIDNQHLIALITGGKTAPVTVRSFNAYQKDASKNVTG